jgi:hypothetical protein
VGVDVDDGGHFGGGLRGDYSVVGLGEVPSSKFTERGMGIG